MTLLCSFSIFYLSPPCSLCSCHPVPQTCQARSLAPGPWHLLLAWLLPQRASWLTLTSPSSLCSNIPFSVMPSITPFKTAPSGPTPATLMLHFTPSTYLHVTCYALDLIVMFIACLPPQNLRSMRAVIFISVPSAVTVPGTS